ncbi:MAG: hypothetical protein ACSHXK_11465 [Oceanococcus sp.]
MIIWAPQIANVRISINAVREVMWPVGLQKAHSATSPPEAE